MRLQRLSALIVLFLSTIPGHADVGHKLSLLAPAASVSVDPAVAPPGTPRKIVVAGMWPDACVPTNAQIGFPPSSSASSDIGILLTQPISIFACATVVTPYRFELSYTPAAAGQAEILVMSSRAAPLAIGTLVTGDAQAPKGLYDVTGAWYDPQTTGSGLQVIHDFGQTDGIVATWQVFDPANGASHWYSLQQGSWQADGLAWSGLLYELKADPSGCTAPCASPFSHVTFVGVARLTFSASFVHGGLDAAMDLLAGDGTPRRIANLQRFFPHRIVIQ
jgi:hypothetical protein